MLAAIVPVVTRGARLPKSLTLFGQVVSRYLVKWQRDTSGKCPDKDMGNDTVDASTTNFIMTDLKANSTYFINVTAINEAGEGIKSLHLIQSTHEKGEN